MLSYRGPFNDSITEHIVNLLDAAFQEEKQDPASCRLARSLVVEQIQNVQRFSDQSNDGVVEIGVEEGVIFIETANVIGPGKMGELVAVLDQLRGLDADALRQHYLETLRSPFEYEQMGDGLGLLYLFRQSRRHPEYRFSTAADRNKIFHLKTFAG
jgi:hypothetical protein